MNWNGQRETLEHLIRKISEPDKAASLQAEYNAKRRAKVQSALLTRPIFIPLEFNMTAAGRTSPYRDTTDSFAYDIIITGIKADTQSRSIVVRRTENEKPLVYVGEELNLFLRLDEIAGQSTTLGGGQLGVFYFPSPIKLIRGQRLTVEMFKTEATVDPEEANIVLIGLRVLPRLTGELAVSDKNEKDRINFLIDARESPSVVFLKQTVDFATAGVGGIARNLQTPPVEEPLLVRGVRTSMRQSLIELRIQGEPNWTLKPTPIWGVAAEDELIHDNYQWFSKPIYLGTKNTIEIERVTNGLDGVNIDPQTGNTITWLCETV